MPIKNGLEATKELLKLNDNLKIIFISAHPYIKELALSLGVVYFLDKPFDLEELINSINNVLEPSLEEPKQL